jgi:hypothetical protein
MFERLILVVWVILGALAAHSADAADRRVLQWRCHTGNLAVKVDRVGNEIVSRHEMMIGTHRVGVVAFIDELETEVTLDRVIFRGSSRTATAELEVPFQLADGSALSTLHVSRMETGGRLRVPLNSEIPVLCTPAVQP